MASRAKSLRMLIVLAAALLALLAVADLRSPDSVLRSAWHRLRGTPETPAERIIHGLKKARDRPEAPRR